MTRVEVDVSLKANEDAPTIGNAVIATDSAPERDAPGTRNAVMEDGNARYADAPDVVG